MTDRIIEIAETSSHLRLENGLMCLDFPSGEKVTVPVTDIQCLIIANPGITVTGVLLAALSEAGVIVVISDTKCMPVSMQIPLVGNYAQSEKFQAQITASLPLRKQLWKSVVKAKIHNQMEVLCKLHSNDFGLKRLWTEVKSGDPENIEAQAARIYWQKVFDVPFQRDRDRNDNNALLNYGYAILRAMTARACCGVGLHPTIGINHHNKYNAYCLADDLMEPFRCVVDRCVYEINPLNLNMALSREIRSRILNSLLQRWQIKKGYHTISYLLQQSAEQIAKSFMTGSNCLDYS